MTETTTKSRPSASCIPCRTRKVKCTRTTPCTTCVSRNHPEECVYTASDIDREAMRQADIIAQLRGRARNLRSVVASLSPSPPPVAPGSRDSDGTVFSGDATGTGAGTGMGAGIGTDFNKNMDNTPEDIVYKALCQGRPEVVHDVITQLRSGVSVEDIARSVNYT